MVYFIIGLFMGATLGIVFTSILVLSRDKSESLEKDDLAGESGYILSDQSLPLPTTKAQSI
jgi:hypothetical protein